MAIITTHCSYLSTVLYILIFLSTFQNNRSTNLPTPCMTNNSHRSLHCSQSSVHTAKPSQSHQVTEYLSAVETDGSPLNKDCRLSAFAPPRLHAAASSAAGNSTGATLFSASIGDACTIPEPVFSAIDDDFTNNCSLGFSEETCIDSKHSKDHPFRFRLRNVYINDYTDMY